MVNLDIWILINLFDSKDKSIKALKIRSSVIFSNSHSNFYTWVYNSLKNNQNISVVTDQISNPTYIPDLLQVISDAILLDFSGTLHIGSEDYISRYDFANQISDVFGLRNILIKPTESSFLNQLAERPLNSSLNCSKVKTELNIELYPAVYGIRRVNLSIWKF